MPSDSDYFPTFHPDGVTTYERDGEFMVAQHQTWLPGIYASQEAAVAAVALDDETLRAMSGARGVGADYRPITLDEVRARL